MNKFNLTFNLKKKTSIYVSFHENESIIDLCLTTEKLTERGIKCRIKKDFDHNFDHFSIETILNISVKTAPPQKKFG